MRDCDESVPCKTEWFWLRAAKYRIMCNRLEKTETQVLLLCAHKCILLEYQRNNEQRSTNLIEKI